MSRLGDLLWLHAKRRVRGRRSRGIYFWWWRVWDIGRHSKQNEPRFLGFYGTAYSFYGDWCGGRSGRDSFACLLCLSYSAAQERATDQVASDIPEGRE